MFIFATLIAISQALSQESEDTQLNYSVDTTFVENDNRLRDRNTLTGNWGGIRTNLNYKGIIFKGSFTNFYQGMVSGEGKPRGLELEDFTEVRCRVCKGFYLHEKEDFLRKVATANYRQLVCPECNRTGGLQYIGTQRSWPGNGLTVKERIIRNSWRAVLETI